MTDTERLRSAIERSGLKYKYIASELHLTPYGLQKKINNESEFKASELYTLSGLLGLSDAERSAIFFARASENKSREDEPKRENTPQS